MENIKLPYVGEILWSIQTNIPEEVKVLKVEYINTASSRTVKIKTNKGEIELWELCETEHEARNKINIFKI
jgi:hypothetical protein